MKTFITALTITLAACMFAGCSTEYHVAKTGLDGNPGTRSKPFKTISAAAQIAQPGDVVTVHEGIYRERVNPPRGGESDDKRIVYQAAPGEKVVIKGSEIVKGWEYLQNDTWKVTLPNSFFGDFNPYSDVIGGEWYYTPKDGYDRHTGAVYLNEQWLTEARELGLVLKPTGEKPFWFGKVEGQNTMIWAQFKDANPNQELVEINVRQSIFYPDQPGRNYITVRGFVMLQAASPWAGAMSEQIALIGTHWSKGWIIENNVISHSINSGITLGMRDLSKLGVTIPIPNAVGYTKFTREAIKKGWTKEKVGSHIVRNNHISHCEKNGIHGSLGGAFCTIDDNIIHDIAMMGWVNGPDIGALKLLGGIDSVIRGNCVYNVRGRGIWLDWMGQGSVIQNNLVFDTHSAALYLEVNHGPIVVANNILLSNMAHTNRSRGTAYVHNLFGGQCILGNTGRRTPYLKPHSTTIVGMHENYNGDDHFYNNIFSPFGSQGKVTPLSAESKPAGRPTGRVAKYDNPEMPVEMEGNIYINGAMPPESDKKRLVFDGETTNLEVIRKVDGFYIEWASNPDWLKGQKRKLIKSEMLGRARIPNMKYENADGSSICIDTDYFGNKRNTKNPYPGPFTKLKEGKQLIKVWPRK